MDLIWFSLDRVENKYSSTSFSLAKELARKNRVFYVDNPVTLAEAYKKKSQRKDSVNASQPVTDIPANFIPITPHKTLPINWMSDVRTYEWGSLINNYLLNRSIKKVISDYLLRDYIFVNVFNPFYARSFASDIKPFLKVYYSVDDIRYSPYVKKHGPRLEAEIVSSYDITLTTSRELQTLLSKFSPTVHCLPNAADIPLFKTAMSRSLDRPEDIKHLNQPIILYTGHVDWRVNINLLKAIARHNSDKVLLLVGPVSLDQATMDSLREIPNIIFTGSKKLEQLPAYLQHAHCAIIPFKCNALTKSIYPLKINEYLAAGLPVVSTNFSEDIREFNNVIDLEDQELDFVNKIKDAINTNSQEKIAFRSQVAEQNSWEARAEQFWNIMGGYYNR